MAGTYPAVASPHRNLPTNMLARFFDVAIRIHPTRSGNDMIRMDFLRPYFKVKIADKKPPNMAPSPKIEALKNSIIT